MMDETTPMPKIKILVVVMAALFASAAYAVSPTDGHVAAKSYVNTYFHFTYSWPAMLEPMNAPAPSAADNDPKAYAFKLFSARQGQQPYGVVVVAEKLNVAGPHSTGVKNSADFVDRIAHSLRPGPVLSNINRGQKKNAHGVVFDELSYTQNGEPATVIATQLGDFLIVFKCNAKTAADMSQMEQSALNLHMTK
jgi:hypothetical protein